MNYLLVAITLVLYPCAAKGDEFVVPPPFDAVIDSGEYCNSEEELHQFLSTKEKAYLAKLTPPDLPQGGCSTISKEGTFHFEPITWQEYLTCWVLISKATAGNGEVLFMHLHTVLKEESV